jgi:enamine deaminase RidA (YjgF/YER057c/UK114 family)
VTVEATLTRLGLELPDLEDMYRANPYGARHVSHVAVRDTLYVSAHTPRRNNTYYLPGMITRELTLEQGYEAARYAAVTVLGVVKYALGDLDRVSQLVQMQALVHCPPGFTQFAHVLNGATDLFVELYGERGRSTRMGIGTQAITANASVELCITLVFEGEGVRPGLARDYARE